MVRIMDTSFDYLIYATELKDWIVIFFSLVCCKHSFTQLSIYQNSISSLHSPMGREEASRETLDFINIAQITHFVYSLHGYQFNHDFFFHIM
jgi:hypothetical protein